MVSIPWSSLPEVHYEGGSGCSGQPVVSCCYRSFLFRQRKWGHMVPPYMWGWQGSPLIRLLASLWFYSVLCVAGPHTSSVFRAGQVEEEMDPKQLTEGCCATWKEAEVMVMWWPLVVKWVWGGPLRGTSWGIWNKKDGAAMSVCRQNPKPSTHPVCECSPHLLLGFVLSLPLEARETPKMTQAPKRAWFDKPVCVDIWASSQLTLWTEVLCRMNVPDV